MSYSNQGNIARIQGELGPLPQAFDLIGDHVVITDPDGIIVYANPAVREQTGYDPKNVIGENPGKLWGGNMPDSFYENMWKTIKTDKKAFVGEVKNKRKDGVEYWQELRIFPVLDENKEIKIFIGIEPNITVRKIAEGEQKRRFEAVDRLNKFMIGRELKILELKKEIEKLKSQLEKTN